ncbi:uncharacterized protein LOC132550514 [Ylistrum balloti]|uniref:uncharacterized protein LOC132550514 n=1 Tax=Ylistrum balloti TaxID=509963 RepID=UPI002905DAFE|nr:uncharacterized protein LOC132550514 [Ylistrum balloti]
MMNLNMQSLFSEEMEIRTDEESSFVCRSSSAHVLQPLVKTPDDSLLTRSTDSVMKNDGSQTTANGRQQKLSNSKGLVFKQFENQGQNLNSGSTHSGRNGSQPGTSEDQQKISKVVKSEPLSSVINTAKQLCKSGKINSSQLQQLLKYVTQSRSITGTTSGRTDQAKLASLISQLTQQTKGKHGDSQQSTSQQVDLEGQQVRTSGQQVNLGIQQVQSSSQQVVLAGLNTHVQHIGTENAFKLSVAKDLCKTTSTVKSVCHPVLCQTTEHKNASTNTVTSTSTSISSQNQGTVVTKMLQGIDLQTFTPVDQALSLFEVSPTLQLDMPQFHPQTLNIVSESLCSSTPTVSVKSATTPPTQIDVGPNPDNSITENNGTSCWEYTGTNLADLLIPDTSGLEAAPEDNACSNAFLASGDGHLQRMLKTGPVDEIPGTSGIMFSDNNLQGKTQSDMAVSEFYCRPEKVQKLGSSTAVSTNIPGFKEFALPSTNSKSSNLRRKRYKKTADALQGSGLMDITLKTAELIQRNRKLQKEIEDLKCEAAQFYQSVLQNPENREFGEKFKMAQQQSMH